MTELLEKAIAKLRKLPNDRQDEAAELVLSMVGQDITAIQLSPEQIVEVERRLKNLAESVPHEEVRAR